MRTMTQKMVPDRSLVGWLAYADVDVKLSAFVGGDYIVTDAFSFRQLGDSSIPEWEMEEWSVARFLCRPTGLRTPNRHWNFTIWRSSRSGSIEVDLISGSLRRSKESR